MRKQKFNLPSTFLQPSLREGERRFFNLPSVIIKSVIYAGYYFLLYLIFLQPSFNLPSTFLQGFLSSFRKDFLEKSIKKFNLPSTFLQGFQPSLRELRIFLQMSFFPKGKVDLPYILSPPKGGNNMGSPPFLQGGNHLYSPRLKEG